MSVYADVALPVPLDRAFTYELGEFEAEVGARVMVPFGGQQLVGIVVGLHDTQPAEDVEVKRVQHVMDEAALLPDELMELGRWIAAYYCAPLGEVLRGMMPLTAEVKRQWTYRIGEQGRRVLYDGAAKGSSRRSKLSVEDQNREYAVLNYLESGEPAKTAALRSATGANKALLDAMTKKKWLVREPLQEVRDARRTESVAILEEEATGSSEQGTGEATRRLPKLNDNQLAVMAELAGCGGRELVRELRTRLTLRRVPESTLGTLVKRGLVRFEETAQTFHVTSLSQDGKKFAHEHALNEAQTEALAVIAAAMDKGGFRPHLLYGVTGSGKTAVYVAAMQRALSANKSALLLVPEIGLTPGTAAQMVAAFGGEVALLHSQLTPDERAEQWHRIRRGDARVVIGTRSAVFAAMPNLGLILVDEEHDSSYKQEETPRYHGRDVAVMRAKLLGCTVVLGSATPSLESWNNAERGRYTRIEMLTRVAERPLPAVEMIDMREEFRATGSMFKGQEQLFSRRLLEETQAALDRGEQVIILLNRRGYSFVVMCRSCGEKLQCENCAISLTYHKGGGDSEIASPGQRLECHYCGYRRAVPQTCPKCQSEHLYYLGAGSQQGEERLQELFPNARIGRMDRDTVRGRSDMERLLQRLHSGEINLLVGTQMIAKGHDIHGVTLVGVVGADFALGLPDFRAAERVFQLLTQVSGRAGRGELPGRVLVQTYQPEHYVNQFAQQHDYTGFATREMYFRRSLRYPPLSVLANVIVQGEHLEEVLDYATKLGRWLAKHKPGEMRMLGPAPAPNARLKRIYRYHLVLKAERRDVLAPVLRALLDFADAVQIPRRSLVIDVDPIHLM